jgi:hypothetical protein
MNINLLNAVKRIGALSGGISGAGFKGFTPNAGLALGVNVDWTCSLTRSVIEQVLQKVGISSRNPHIQPFFSGSCSKTSPCWRSFRTTLFCITR